MWLGTEHFGPLKHRELWRCLLMSVASGGAGRALRHGSLIQIRGEITQKTAARGSLGLAGLLESPVSGLTVSDCVCRGRGEAPGRMSGCARQKTGFQACHPAIRAVPSWRVTPCFVW